MQHKRGGLPACPQHHLRGRQRPRRRAKRLRLRNCGVGATSAGPRVLGGGADAASGTSRCYGCSFLWCALCVVEQGICDQRGRRSGCSATTFGLRPRGDARARCVGEGLQVIHALFDERYPRGRAQLCSRSQTRSPGRRRRRPASNRALKPPRSVPDDHSRLPQRVWVDGAWTEGGHRLLQYQARRSMSPAQRRA